MRLKDYKTLVFDCDGVILDSNAIKTRAFYIAALPYGVAAAEQLVLYHVANGGISRYRKFDFFLKEILKTEIVSGVRDDLLSAYAREVKTGLLNCNIASGLLKLRHQTATSTWMVVSGGDQEELREIFVIRGISRYFNGGIYGSPDTKDAILGQLKTSGSLRAPGIFFGDSRLDHQAATRAGLDFVFVTEWTEFQEWENYCADHGILTIKRLSDCLAWL